MVLQRCCIESCIGIGMTFNGDAVSLTIDILGWVNQNQIERKRLEFHIMIAQF